MRRPSAQEVLPGIVVSRNLAGGVSVIEHGQPIGWLHASVGDVWSAYVLPGTLLGKFKLDAAAQAVVIAFHEKSA